MFTTASFYKSKEWQGLIQLIKSSRINDEGLLICEHCGKPIIAAYDCIGHHEIHLTDDNVNDYSVSLNPDLIRLVHHKCHNRIHNKLGIGCKKVFIVYGSPLSGKSTFVLESMSEGDIVVDMDSIWKCISWCSDYVKPKRLKSTAFIVRDFLIDNIRTRNGKWNNAWIIGGYPYEGDRERLIKFLGAESIFIDTPKEECILRLTNNPAGRNINDWTVYINDWWHSYDPKVY